MYMGRGPKHGMSTVVLLLLCGPTQSLAIALRPRGAAAGEGGRRLGRGALVQLPRRHASRRRRAGHARPLLRGAEGARRLRRAKP